MNFCSQFQNKNFMQKKALKMNQGVARTVEEPASNNVMVTGILVTEKSAKCLKPFVQPVVKRQLYLLSLPVKDQFIVGNASRPDAIVN